jgi:multidrug resistance protein
MRRADRPRHALPAGFGVIWATVALDLVGFGIVLPILPLYAERFGASPATIGLLVASFSLAQLVFAPIWGRVSDRVGRKPVLVLSLAGTAVGSLLTGLAGSLWLLFAARILDGISGASVSVAQAAVADIAEPDERPRLLGLLGAAFGVGFVVGPALGGLAALGGPEVPFLLAAALAGANALVAARRLPETKPSQAAPDALATAVEETRRSRALAMLLVVGFTAYVAFSGFEATFALLGEDRFGLDEASIGMVFAAVGLFHVLVQVRAVGPVTARLGLGRALRAGLAAQLAGLLLVAVDGGWPTLVAGLAAVTAGTGLVTPSLSSSVAAVAHVERRGAALGVQQSAGAVGRVLGPVLAGVLFEHVAVPAPYLVGAVLLLASLAFVPGRVVERQGSAVTS